MTYASEAVPSAVGSGPEGVLAGVWDGPDGALDEVFIEGWVAIDEPRRILRLGYGYWSYGIPEIMDDDNAVQRKVSDGADPEGRRWLLAWLRAAWPGYSVAVARSVDEPRADLLGGKPLSTIRVHPDPADLPATGDAATEAFRSLADAFANGFFSWGDWDFLAEQIRPIREIARRLGVRDWEPRAFLTDRRRGGPQRSV
jgi:hypothetical protein